MTANCPHDEEALCRGRRGLLKASMAIALTGIAIRDGLSAELAPAKQPPQPGDELWLPSWETESRALTIDDFPPQGPPVNAVPYDPVAKVLRERSRLNQLLILRLDSAAPSMEVELIAYSGICTHAACGVSEWNADTRRLLCPCHGSEFDPAARGAVTAGPAPRALPTLPIKIIDRGLIVAGPYSAPVGAKKG